MHKHILELDVSDLDPKIAPYVIALNTKASIVTYESCQGGEGHCSPEPFIHFRGSINEGHKALAFANMNCWPVSELQRVWSMIDGEPNGPYWRLIFIGSKL